MEARQTTILMLTITKHFKNNKINKFNRANKSILFVTQANIFCSRKVDKNEHYAQLTYNIQASLNSRYFKVIVNLNALLLIENIDKNTILTLDIYVDKL